MKYLTLIILSCLLSADAHATFELEDPADPNKQLEMEKKQKPIFKSKAKPDQVIIVAGTGFYLPVIEDGICVDWRAASSDAGPDETGNTLLTSSGNLLGQVVKAVECNKGASRLNLSLVQTGTDSLVWVETGKLLDTD